MRQVFIVGTDGYNESIVNDKFAETLWGTIGIIKDHYNEMYNQYAEYKNFVFGESYCGRIKVTFDMAIVWGHEDSVDWDSNYYYVYELNNVTNKK